MSNASEVISSLVFASKKTSTGISLAYVRSRVIISVCGDPLSQLHLFLSMQSVGSLRLTRHQQHSLLGGVYRLGMFSQCLSLSVSAVVFIFDRWFQIYFRSLPWIYSSEVITMLLATFVVTLNGTVRTIK